jgi:UDP-GlcNAc:undecaprenyl-phosphate GlcNAc-1-phosphate transferase
LVSISGDPEASPDDRHESVARWREYRRVTGQLLSCALVFAVSFLLVQVLARMAKRVGLVDYPGRRKRHRGEIPLIGGPAIFGGLCFGVLLTADTLHPYRPLFAALAVLLIAGMLDDLRDLSPRQKFLAQLVAGLCMVYWAGSTVLSLGDLLGIGNISTDAFAIPFTLIALLGLINAINMADGADGLAAGLSLIAFLFLAISAVLIGHPVSARILFAIIAVVLAFWAMNMRFPWQAHAKVFLGDSGSMMLGMLLTWFSVEVARGRSGIPPIVAVWFLAVPLLDMGVVILRRLVRGHSPFQAGRDHFHHMLIAAGMSPGTAVLCVLLLALVLAASGFFAWRAGVPEPWLFYTFVALLFCSSALSWQWTRFARRLRRRRRSPARLITTR